MKRSGTITISKVSGGMPDESVRVMVEDELSQTRFLEVSLSPEAFALALFGRSELPCQFDLRDEHVGQKIENMEKVVKIPPADIFRLRDEKTCQRLLKPHEKNGWRGAPEDLNNYHRQVADGYRVRFTRWVESDDKD